MTAEEFAEQIETLIEAGRAGGLSDTAIRDALEEAGRRGAGRGDHLMPSEYDTDIALWAENQARALRAAARTGTNLPIDWENVAEEIEGVAASQKREVRSRLRRICQHLLKWHYQFDHQSPSWQKTIVEQRRQLQDLFEDSPSLRQFAENALPAAFNNGREDAELETLLLHLPNQCPWTFEKIVAHDFWPG